jgi:hypothetical protein
MRKPALAAVCIVIPAVATGQINTQARQAATGQALGILICNQIIGFGQAPYSP